MGFDEDAMHICERDAGSHIADRDWVGGCHISMSDLMLMLWPS